MPATGKDQALDTVITELRRRYGEGAIMRLGGGIQREIDVIPTGSLAVDIALGIGGIPRGRVTEVYGPESAGKTTLCLCAVAQAQKAGGVAAYIDMEHALDPSYAHLLGVDVEALFVSQPDTGEQALEIAEALVRSGAVDIVVVDSVAALVPRAEIEGEMGDVHPGLQARLMSQALRKLSGAIKQSNTAMVFTNQIRMKIGVMFGSPETTPGGNALKFYSSVRMDMRRIESLKRGGEVYGNRVRVTVRKNKVAPPFREAEFDILYDEGISRAGDILDLGADLGVIDKRGAYYSYGDTRLGQGRDSARDFLRQNQDMALEIENLIRQKKGLPVLAGSSNGGEARVDQVGAEA
ncbi:MAG: recombinase RecA [Anaerolineae bacterium]